MLGFFRRLDGFTLSRVGDVHVKTVGGAVNLILLLFTTTTSLSPQS
jgi:hypothetical protein